MPLAAVTVISPVLPLQLASITVVLAVINVGSAIVATVDIVQALASLTVIVYGLAISPVNILED